jgi:phospholipid/cholesterol/gamma-HCH transport system substrate-binding protein
MPVLGDRGQIDATRTSTYVGVDRFTAILNADTRAYAQVVLQELQSALTGRDVQLRQTIDELAPVLGDTTRVTNALAERRQLLASLVTQLDRVFGTLGQRGTELAAVISAGRQTLHATGARNAELAGTMQALPSTLSAVRQAFSAVEQLSVPLTPALERLRPAAKALPAAVRSLRAFIPTGFELTDALGSLVRIAPPGVQGLQRVFGQLAPAARALEPGAARLNDAVTPVANDLGSGAAAIGLSRVAGVVSTDDPLGPVARGTIVAAEQANPVDYGLPANASPAARARMFRQIDLSLNLTCLLVNAFACRFRTIIPGLSEYLPPSMRKAAR